MHVTHAFEEPSSVAHPPHPVLGADSAAEATGCEARQRACDAISESAPCSLQRRCRPERAQHARSTLHRLSLCHTSVTVVVRCITCLWHTICLHRALQHQDGVTDCGGTADPPRSRRWWPHRSYDAYARQECESEAVHVNARMPDRFVSTMNCLCDFVVQFISVNECICVRWCVRVPGRAGSESARSGLGCHSRGGRPGPPSAGGRCAAVARRCRCGGARLWR